MSGGVESVGRGRGRDRCVGVCTSLTCGLKLSRVAVLPIASYSAGADLDHVAGVRSQPVQLHGVLLAGHCGGDALTLQYQEEGCVSVGPDAHRPLPTPTQYPRLCSQGPLTLSGVIFLSQGFLLSLEALTFSKYFIS